MDNKQSQLLMAQIHLMEAMLGSLMATHPDPEKLKTEFSKAKVIFLENMKKRGYSKDVLKVSEDKFGAVINQIGNPLP
jgi:ribosomal protein S8